MTWELGEGVKRIYQEMEGAYLPPPVYEETGQTVLLTLQHNMDQRRKKRSARISARISAAWPTLEIAERRAVELVFNQGKLTTSKYAVAISRSRNYAVNLLGKLEAAGLLQKHAKSVRDPHQYYTLKNGAGD